MEQQGHGQSLGLGAQLSYGLNPFQTQTGAANGGSQSAGQSQLPYDQIHQQQQQQQQQQQEQQQQQQQLQSFWANQHEDIQNVTDFKSNSLPLARIKKIMKADEDVRMISAEAPVVFARACEMFILELTLRSWNHTEENKRRTLQKNDIAAAITRTDIFDFLVDIVPREDLKDEVLASIPRGTLPVNGPADTLPYYMPMGKPVMDPAMHAQNYMGAQIWPRGPDEQQLASNNHQQPWYG